jgi:ligand-binding sensor domain-containing protein
MTGAVLHHVQKFLILFLILTLRPCADAQVRFDGIPYIRNYTRQEYNSSPFNWGVVQDKRGMIYIANNYHILEFDGNAFRAIPLPNRTVIRSLAVDGRGTVYVGGQADFGYLQPDNKGDVSFVSLKSKIDSAHRVFADVWRTLVTESGVVFCTTAGIYYYSAGKIHFYKTDNEASGLTTYFYISQRLFLCTEKQGMYELKNNELVRIPGSERISSRYITGMLPAPGNRILLVTQKSGIFSYDGYTSFEPWEFEAQDEFLNGNVIVCAAAVPKGYLLGSSQNGLLMISREGKTILHLNKAKGLQNNAIEYIYPDYNGNLWLALRDGIDYIEINSPFTIFNGKSGISGSGFTSWIDGERLYLGTSEGLYYKDNNNNVAALSDPGFRLMKGADGQTYNLQKIEDALYLTHNLGIFQVKESHAQRIGTQTGAWLVLPLLTDPGYYVCGSYNGLYLYAMKNGVLTFLWKIPGFDESSRVMEQDDEGNIWIAHGYLGLYKIRLSSDLRKIDKLEFYNSAHGFPSNVFINVFKVNNQLVFAGERGVYSYDKKKNVFVPHELFNNLINKNNHTRKLVEDKEGDIWFSSGDEIGVMKKRTGESYEITKTIFNKLQRRLVGGFEHIAYYDENNVIIGTDDGFVHFDPSFGFNADHTFSTVIRKVVTTAEKDSVISGGWFSAMKDSATIQPEDQVPLLPYSQNALKFTFSATSFEDADKVEYQYKLDGYDENWSQWTRSTNKEYTNLREGAYVFHVRSRDIYNREGTEASYRFVINPPWYRTVLAYCLYVVFITALVYLIIRIAKYEQQKRMRLKEIEHHEEVLRAEKEIIKLNNEKLESELAHKNKELASSAMHIVHSAEAIQKIRNALIEAIESVQDTDAKHQIRKVLRSVANETTLENNWEQFEMHFNQIHQDFLVRLRKEFPDLTHSDIKLISYLKLNLSTKEIAPLLNLSVRGVEASRYRIRKKMNLNPSVNLTEFILKY